jgi:glycogen synthase
MFDGEPPGTAGGIKRYWLATGEAPGFGGGIGVYTHQTARMLAAHGVDVTVFHHDATVAEPSFRWADGYRLLRFGSTGLDRRPIPHANLQGPLRAARETAHVLLDAIAAAEGAPDVVEFPDYAALGHAFLKHRLIHADQPWPRVVLTAHRPNLHCLVTDDDSPHEHRAAFLGEAERWCYAAADAVFAPCRFILAPLAEMGFPVGRAEVVFNPFAPSAGEATGLEPEALELQRRLHTPDEPVLMFGKLQAQKGAPDLLASLAALWAEGEAPPLWLWGRDAFLSGAPTTTLDALERRHRSLFASGQVRYGGGYGAPDLRRLCREHPVVALPYREDCLPYAFIEAVLAGALPLTSPRGGQLELVPEPLRPRLGADVAQPDAWLAKARALLQLGPAERALLSAELQASVRAAVDPAAVYARKTALLRSVEPRYRQPDYPFVQGPVERANPPDPARRAALAAALPERGPVREVRRAGPDLQPHPDLVSVVVPYHEMQDYLPETLAAIEAQDHTAVEVVIVDDGSSSPCAHAALEAVLAAPRRFPTRVVHKLNGGLADARNAGARVARGAYLYFLDADDLIHPSLIGRSLRLLQRFGNVGYVGAGLKEFGETDAEWAVHDIDGPYVAFHNLQICAFLVRSELWLAHGWNDPRMDRGMEDYESHLRMFAAGVRGIALAEPLFSYRKRPGSMSKGFEPHAMAYLYRRAWRNSPELLRRFAPELVGLYAENGHGALAPSVGVESPAHRALFARDIPDRAALAHDLERRASRERLGQALRGRCADGGAEWDYTTARLLLALDCEPAFARQLLRSAVSKEPENGWFRLYAMVAELRDGRIGAADALWSEPFADFCHAEQGALGWVVALEAARGFPHVALALQRGFRARAEVDGPEPPLDLCPTASPGGPFAPLYAALERLLEAGRRGPRTARAALGAVQASAEGQLSAEAVDALARRWRGVWIEAGLLPGVQEPRSTFWGRTAGAYLAAARTPASAAPELADRAAWVALRPPEPLARSVATAGRRLRRLAARVGAEPALSGPPPPPPAPRR